METFVERFPHLVLYVFGGLLLALAPILFWCLLKRTGALDRLSAATHWLSTRPRLEQMLVLVLLAGVIVYGSTKDGDNSASPRLRVRPMAEAPSTPVVTAADVARGWRESGSDADGPVEMPAGAVTNDLLRRRGGHDWAFRVEPDNWRSSWRGGFLTGVTVFARGEVRPDVGTLYFPVPLTNGVSLLPEARWGMLSHAEGEEASRGGAEARSVFSHAVTTNGSLLLDWRNAAVGRDANSPTNMQMEIFDDGSFVWRTDGGSTSYLPVLPFDWDGDGLENSVDPEPFAPNPVDAHGTSTEWCRVVCSNVFETAGGDLGWKEGVNSNAYYFVDVVAEEGPAPVWFNADRDSRLGSPVVVARAGETNRVPLLIGVEYTVTSTVPIAVTADNAMHAGVIADNDRALRVKWPLEFDYSAMDGGYVVTVGPYDPGGEIEWERTSLFGPFGIGGVAGLLSSSPPAACDFTPGERSLSFTCSQCPCAGCSVTGRFCLEGACHDLGGFCCNCVYSDPHGEDEPGGGESVPGSPDSPGVSVRFTRPAVVFEDAYANSPTETVGRRSTSTMAVVEAYGGSDGGVVVVTMANSGKLKCMGGPSLPTSFTVAPYSHRTISVGYEGIAPSGFEGDIVVTARIADSTASATATSVRLEVVPQVLFPRAYPNRHKFGVCEEIKVHAFPSSLTGFDWEVSSGVLVGACSRNSQDFTYLLGEGQFTLSFTFSGVNYGVLTACYRPSDIVCQEFPVSLSGAAAPGEAGGIGMQMNLTLLPETVSFNGIRVMERITEDGVPLGYFSQECFSSWWNHQHVQGAGQLVPIGSGNHVTDVAELADVCPELPDGYWSSGSITWTIPCAWKEPSGFSISTRLQDYTTKQQRFLIDEMGTVQVEKFGCRALRTTMGYTAVFMNQ